MSKYMRFIWGLVLSLAIIISCTFLGNKLSDPATFSHTIEVLDKNRTTVLSLSASTAVASAAISALPSDLCTPLAEQLSEFATWFLIILSVVYLEKYLLTIFGAAACYFLIPVGCGAILIDIFFPVEAMKKIGWKMVIFGLILLLVIPASVWVSDQINAIYDESIKITVESANAVSDSLIEKEVTESEEDTSVIDHAASLLNNLSVSTAEIIKQFKNVANRFIEATAVMIVTTCLVPVLVVMFFAWLVKTLFGVSIVIPSRPPKPFPRHRLPDSESTDLV